MNYFQLLQKLNQIYDSLIHREVDKNYIIKRIKKSIPYKECKIFGIETLSLPYGKFNVSGLYDPDQDEQGKPSVFIEIAFPKNKKFKFDNAHLRREHWAELCIDLASILGHEFMHADQFRKRNYNWPKMYESKNTDPSLKEIEEYYGDPDEIGAYAFMAATELCLNRFSRPKDKFCIEHTNLYKTYVKIFDEQHPIIIRFVKLSNRYVKKLEKQYHATTFQ